MSSSKYGHDSRRCKAGSRRVSLEALFHSVESLWEAAVHQRCHAEFSFGHDSRRCNAGNQRLTRSVFSRFGECQTAKWPAKWPGGD
jgi:hypothetical protein